MSSTLGALKTTLLATPLAKQWEKIGVKPHHGICVALSSLRTKTGRGIGEFFDLIPLIDWCASLGMDLIQFLPLTDSDFDSSPYFCISGSALNPVFLSLHQLPEFLSSKSLLQKWEELSFLNALPKVDYSRVREEKLALLRLYFREQGFSTLISSSFKEFEKKYPWITMYALFKAIKKAMKGASWKDWPKPLSSPEPKEIEALIQQHQTEISFHLFVQYLCYQQLTQVKDYAGKKGIFLKGDLPLLISEDSVEVWSHQKEFDLTLFAGAPPDMYAPEGQAWGLPLPKWEEMEKNNYTFWKERFTYASAFYDLYRLDHVLGFFRLWAIPKGEKSKNGHFIPSEKSSWIHQGKAILNTFLPNTEMLPIAEDLGMVFDGLRPALAELGICGTKVLRWERESFPPYRFLSTKEYLPLSLTTVSTHDSEPLALWWKERSEEANAYALQKGWHYSSTLTQERRWDILYESHHTTSLFHINLLGEYLALFPELVWDNPEEERINVPGTVSSTNWAYRMRPFLEEVISHLPLQTAIQNLLSFNKSNTEER